MSASSPASLCQRGRRYRLIAYLRIDPEDDDLSAEASLSPDSSPVALAKGEAKAEPLTYEQALAEKEQQELLCPENIYRIEEIPGP